MRDCAFTLYDVNRSMTFMAGCKYTLVRNRRRREALWCVFFLLNSVECSVFVPLQEGKVHYAKLQPTSWDSFRGFTMFAVNKMSTFFINGGKNKQFDNFIFKCWETE